LYLNNITKWLHNMNW